MVYLGHDSLALYDSEVYDLIVDTLNYNVSAADTTHFQAVDNSTIHHRYNITTNGIIGV